MAGKRVLLIDESRSLWASFLQEFLDETQTRLCVCHDSQQAVKNMTEQAPDLIFASPPLLSLPLQQKIKALQASVLSMRLFSVGEKSSNKKLFFDDHFDCIPEMDDFLKRILLHLPLPEKIDLLIIDDEKEISDMLRDFLQGRSLPTVQVRAAYDGVEGISEIEKKLPDIVLLDIKMPVKGGREVYRTIIRRQWDFPVVIFFDAIMDYEMSEIRKLGKPAVVEKGSSQSSPPELMHYLKKMVYFS